MNISMFKIKIMRYLKIKPVLLSLIFCFLFCGNSWAQMMTSQSATRTIDVELKEKPNPHWKSNTCRMCHDATPQKGKSATFKFDGDFNKLCLSCHDTAVFRAEEHVVGIPVKENELFKKPSADFPLQNGKITCITCHDVRLQEKNNLSAKESNPMFIRGAPYDYQMTFEWNKSETDDERYSQNRYMLCFKCHRKGPLLQWSPHQNQITKTGKINEEQCFICHSEIPDRAAVEKSEWRLLRKLKEQCINCHMGKTRFHPIRVTHYGNTIPQKIYSQIKYSERRIGIIVPMDFDSKGVERLVCTSCHNPHQRGVLKNKVTSKGADTDRRLRLDGFAMCLACHGTAV